MEIYLVRHGRALPVTVDPDKGLSPEGMEEVRNLVRLALKNNVIVTSIKCSNKKRAKITAGLLVDGLKCNQEAEQVNGLNPEDNVRPWISELELKNGQMLVGHNPFMEILCSALISSAEKNSVRFSTANMVCLIKKSGDKKWELKWKIPTDL